jgi:quercetin dioxygenase-like cupin family protein
MAGTLIDPDDLAWESWEGPAPEGTARRWKILFSAARGPTEALSFGLAEFQPGAVLPLHHHAPAEIYHAIEGEGLVEVEGEAHRLRAGMSLFIPAGARHRSTNVGTGVFGFLFVFPTDSFEEIEYHFDE